MKIPKGARLIILGVLLVVIDQVIKILVRQNMLMGEQIDVIGQWFKLCYIENEGMAFGMKFGGKVGKFLLSLFRIVLSGALIWWISDLIKKEKAPTGVLVGLTLITAGAIGNIVDCLFYGVIFDYAEYVLRSEDGYTWTFQSKGWGGVGWRGYRLLTFVDVDMTVLLKNITEAYQSGKVSDFCDNLLYAGEFIPWSDLTSEQFNAVYEALKEAAIDKSYYLVAPIIDDHLYRDLYMMYAAAKTDGAYSEIFFDILLPMQYDNDPDAFLAALNELPEDVYAQVGPNLSFIR